MITGLLVGALGLLVTITRVWVTVELDSSAAAQTTVTVSGSAGIQSLMPVAIALLAIALVLSIAGRGLRMVLGALTTLFGAWITWVVWTGTQRGEGELVAFAGPAITEVTGLVTSDPAGVVTQIDATPWPIVTLVCGLVVAVLGIATTVFGWRWVRGGKRYEARSVPRRDPARTDRIADWDALTGGQDPSDWEGAPDDR